MFVNTASTYTPCEPMLLPLNQNRPRANRARPVNTSAPTPTSCLYARSIVPFGLNDGHLEVALQELLHRGVFRRQDLFRRPDGADLGLPQQGDAVGDPERAAHIVRHFDAGDAQLLLQPLDQ